MIFCAVMTSTIIKTEDQGNKLSYSIILAQLLIEIIFMDPEVTLKFFYSKIVRKLTYVNIIRFWLEKVPTFSWSLAYGLIAAQASSTFDYNKMNWVKGHPYPMEKYYQNTTDALRAFNDVLYTPAPAHFMGQVLTVCLIYCVLAWYFDHVFSSNRGVGYSFYFMF